MNALARRLRDVACRALQRLTFLRLRLDAQLAALTGAGPGAGRQRIVATACWTFPIYSQTFVYQEVFEMARRGFAVRFFFSGRDARDKLGAEYDGLWRLRRRLPLDRSGGARDLRYYRRRMPAKVAAIEQLLAEHSGLSLATLRAHEHFLHAFTFTRAVEAWRADYIHSYFFYERTLFALVASRLLDIPRGVSCYADHLLDDYELKLTRLHLTTSEVIVATSQRIRRELETICGSTLPHVLVKPNAVGVEPLPSVPEPFHARSVRVLTACRLHPKKGLLHLVQAVRLLTDRGFQLQCDVVGAADHHDPSSVAHESELRQRVRDLDLDGVVRFVGWKPNAEVRRQLRECAVFVLPSVELANGDKDGIPTALLEAMAAGCAIVATDAGSIAEAMEHERDGLIVPQADPIRLAAALQRLLTDGELASRLRAGALARSRRDFDVERCEPALHARIRAATLSRTQAATPHLAGT